MKKFYFTFGTDDKFPYGIDDYVLVQACSYTEAVKIFRKNYPDVHEVLLYMQKMNGAQMICVQNIIAENHLFVYYQEQAR